MEIRLARIYDNHPEEEIRVEFLGSLTIEQFDRLNFYLSEIEELNSLRRLLDFVVMNEDEMRNYLYNASDELIRKSFSWNGVKLKHGAGVFLNVNRLLLNYLSSVRTFLDHSETLLKRKFGSESDQFSDYKRVTADIYDNSFPYRFLYKLRNYAQHVGLPIQNIAFSSEYQREDNLIKGTLNVSFNKEKLLSEFQKWGTVESDLKAIKGELGVMPIMLEMTHGIRLIEKNIERICGSNLLIAANFITELVSGTLDNEGEVFIAYDIETNEEGKLTEYASILLPFETIEIIKNMK